MMNETVKDFATYCGHAINLNLFVCKRKTLYPCGEWISLNKVRLWSDISNVSYKHFIYHFTSNLHGLIRTLKWLAPNVSGFTVQLIRASHRYREVTGSNPIENFLRPLYAIAYIAIITAMIIAYLKWDCVSTWKYCSLWVLNRAFEENFSRLRITKVVLRAPDAGESDRFFRLYRHRIEVWPRNQRNRIWKCQMWTSKVESWHVKGTCRGIWAITPKFPMKTSTRQSRIEENRCERI